MEGDGELMSKAADAETAKKKRPKRKKNKGKSKESDEATDQQLEAIDERGPELWEPPSEDVLAGARAEHEEWVDISRVCDLAAEGMKLGEMIESPQFRLFDAMSAIEIMDPKMDSGFNNSEDMTLDRAEAAGIISQSLTHEELITIWDQLLMYYLLWLEGHTIVQTCFCCLYLQDLKKHLKPMPSFGAFVDAFLVACRRARSAVLRAGVFDDEDFMPGMFGIDLEACVFSSEPTEVQQRIEQEVEALRSDSSPCAERVAWRLQFMAEYMLALVALASEASPDVPSGFAKEAPDEARTRLTACLSLLERLKKSAEVPPPERLRCFDPSINRKLLVPGPPRTVEPIQDPHVAFDMWASHIQELLLCGLLTQKSLMQILEGAVTHKGEPSVLPRSIAQLRVSKEGFVRRLMLESLASHLFPREAAQHCKKAADAFLAHSESLFAHLMKLAHTNCARRFRRLAHVFSDFNALQHEAWRLDEDLKQTFGANLRHPRPCWVWIMEHCLQAMIEKLFLGFDLELYDQAEIHMIYWYVDYLYGLRLFNLNELYHAKEQPVGGQKKKSNSRQQQKEANTAGTRGGLRPRNPPQFLLLLEATQSTVRGLFRLLAFCLRRGLLSAPEAAVSGLAQRFVLRFRALEHFRLPHLPSYNDFEQSSQSAQAPMESRIVLDAAQASFTDAAQLLERVATGARDRPSEEQSSSVLDNAKALRRVVVANQLAVTRLSRSIEAGQILKKTSRVVAATTHHPHLVSVQVLAVE